MFSYYGSKATVIHRYPTPRHNKVIEAFAGSARYALRYFEKDVLIVDKYEVLINVWKWLQQCSPGDIQKLPRMKFGEKIESYTWDCQEAKDFMGFLMGFAAESPRKTVTVKLKWRPNYINYSLNRIANNLFKIRHWDIQCGSYEDIPNQEATWFIDPPYVQNGGHAYIHSSKSIDFDHLKEWCLSREGQIIVCEGTGANWLDFQPIATHRVRNGAQVEMMYTNIPSAFDHKQLTLF